MLSGYNGKEGEPERMNHGYSPNRRPLLDRGQCISRWGLDRRGLSHVLNSSCTPFRRRISFTSCRTQGRSSWSASCTLEWMRVTWNKNKQTNTGVERGALSVPSYFPCNTEERSMRDKLYTAARAPAHRSVLRAPEPEDHRVLLPKPTPHLRQTDNVFRMCNRRISI